MNQGFDEGYYIKNSQRSSIHCIEFNHKTPGVYAIFHYHNYIEILYGLDCDITVWIDDREESFCSGDICLISPMETHYMYSRNQNNHYQVIKFSPELLSYKGQTLAETRVLLPYLQKHYHKNHIIKKEFLSSIDVFQSFQHIFQEWKTEELGFEFAIRGEILNLFSKLLRTKGEGKIFLPTTIDDETTTTILATASYITENLSVISAQDAARHAHMSYSYFSKMFKQVMGKSFSHFLIDARIDEAKRLLLTTDISISEISSNVGFSSLSHFIYTFRKNTDTTPSNYRILNKIL